MLDYRNESVIGVRFAMILRTLSAASLADALDAAFRKVSSSKTSRYSGAWKARARTVWGRSCREIQRHERIQAKVEGQTYGRYFFENDSIPNFHRSVMSMSRDTLSTLPSA